MAEPAIIRCAALLHGHIAVPSCATQESHWLSKFPVVNDVELTDEMTKYEQFRDGIYHIQENGGLRSLVRFEMAEGSRLNDEEHPFCGQIPFTYLHLPFVEILKIDMTINHYRDLRIAICERPANAAWLVYKDLFG